MIHYWFENDFKKSGEILNGLNVRVYLINKKIRMPAMRQQIPARDAVVV